MLANELHRNALVSTTDVSESEIRSHQLSSLIFAVSPFNRSELHKRVLIVEMKGPRLNCPAMSPMPKTDKLLQFPSLIM